MIYAHVPTQRRKSLVLTPKVSKCLRSCGRLPSAHCWRHDAFHRKWRAIFRRFSSLNRQHFTKARINNVCIFVIKKKICLSLLMSRWPWLLLERVPLSPPHHWPFFLSNCSGQFMHYTDYFVVRKIIICSLRLQANEFNSETIFRGKASWKEHCLFATSRLQLS